MNASVVHSLNSPPRYEVFADPVPAEGEVLVQVTAAGLHPIVKALANGTHYGSTGEFPLIPGIDGTGRLPDGSAVYFGLSRPPFGTFAERSLTLRKRCLALPDGLDPVTAAALANPGMSSWVALKFRAGFAAGESVLILGATGVAGQLAVQISKRLAARRVIAAGRNPKALAVLSELGADQIVSLDQSQDDVILAFRREFSETGIDVVLDYLWGAPAESALAAIAQKGLQHAASRIRYVQIGNSAGPTLSLDAATLRSSRLELSGSGFGSASIEQIWQALGEFFASAAKQPYRVEIKTAPLRDVEKLWNEPERGVRVVFQP